MAARRSGLGWRFHTLWAATASANLADGVVLVALPLIALRFTNEPALVAGVRVAGTLPWLVFGLFAGVILDRLDRRKLMVGVTSLRGLALGAAAVVVTFFGTDIVILYATALAVGTASTLYDTGTQTLVPGLVTQDDLMRANGRVMSTQVVLMEFVGSPLGGALVAVSTFAALGAPGLMYVIAGLLLLRISGQHRAQSTDGGKAPPRSVLADIKTGLVELVREPTLRRLAVYASVLNLTESAFMSVFVIYAVGRTAPLRLSEADYGLLLAGAAVGSVAGAILAARLIAALLPALVLSAAAVLLAGSFALPVATSSPVVIGVGIGLAGFAIAVANVLMVTVRQSVVATGILGRVTAGTRLLVFGTIPFGAAFGGLMVKLIGIERLFLTLAIAAVGLVAVTATIRIPALRQSGTTPPGHYRS
ncbi:MFS transporter [Dactylosporangium sp. NPDC050588]|uniref:MFS transporter n=1 Tax=Dactylosporangium sp. NPDC050588 TaxID=3157211 RepID=UPI0033FBAB74